MSSTPSGGSGSGPGSSAGASKRHSIVPPVSQSGPKPPVHFSSTATIADSAVLTGSHAIAVGSDSVVHPRARLDSLGGRVVVGRRCVVHERATLGAIGSEGRVADVAVALGDYVTVEVGAAVEAGDTYIGEGTVVGVGAKVGRGARVGKHCTLTPLTEVAAGEVIPDFTVLYANGLRRTDRRGATELRNKAQTRQIEVLRRMIPSNPAKFM